MIKSLTVVNDIDESLKMELYHPEKTGLLITDIDGIGASKASINSRELVGVDGSKVNSARVNSRQITISLLFLFNPTIEDSRQKTYRYFPIKKKVRLIFETDNRHCEISGYVESNEPDIFSSQEGCTISVICPNPYFYSTGPDGNNTTVLAGVESLFEFPFSNESTSERLLEVSAIKSKTEGTIHYEGDSDVGINMLIRAIGPAENVSIYNITTNEVMKIDNAKLTTIIEGGIKAGDEILINTNVGEKSITFVRDGIRTNIINCLGRDIKWFRLVKGDNTFAYTADTGVENLQFIIYNKSVYEGI